MLLKTPFITCSFYLVLFPEHGEFVTFDGRLHHLHLQVVDTEVQIPEPEDDAVNVSLHPSVRTVFHVEVLTSLGQDNTSLAL